MSRPSLSTSRTRLRIPSGSAARLSRATAIIVGVLLDPRDLMPGAGQPQRLRALAHAHVEHAQPLPHGEPPGYLLVELPGDQFLPYDITQAAQLAQPGIGGAPRERAALRAALRA